MIRKILLVSFTLLTLTACNGVSVQTANVETVDTKVNNTISEQFIITSVNNGIIKGELTNGKGEGIYYNLNELDNNDYDLFSKLNVSDLVRIEWTKDNYDNEEWLDIERVTYNKQGNVSNDNKDTAMVNTLNVSMKAGK